MLSYKTIRGQVKLKNLAVIPAKVASTASMWGILSWACEDITVLDPVPMARVKSIFKQWEKDCNISVGQIISMIKLIESHSAAIEFDLIKLNLRLRDCPSDDFNWRDLWVVLAHASQDSALYSAVNPDSAGWTRQNMLLAEIADATAWLVWSKTKAASKGGSPPDRIPRPGVAKKKAREGSKVKPVPLQRIKEVYGRQEREDPSWGRKLSALFS